ncbi:MAG TPA: GTPase [Candidatus Krumholzibacteriaceae bacterium]|jgi:ribosome-interacting GTPase 1|nr:GTPase [Candidatus Krumholzibacteriaceae bacterium]
MPTNLNAEAKKKWEEIAATREPREKFKLLQEFLALIPKHKGTEKLCKQTKRQIAALRKELEEKKRKRTGTSGPKFFFEKEGAAQIVVLGPTKVGRSSLLASLTNAKVEIRDYPFTTLEPVPGMLSFEDIQFQIIEAPALTEGAAEGEGMGTQILGLARNADGLILMIDASCDSLVQLMTLLDELEKAKIAVQKPRARVDVERKFRGAGLRVLLLGRLIGCTLKDVEELLQSYRIVDAVVRIQGEASLEDIEDAIFEATVYRPVLLVVNKMDTKNAGEQFGKVREFINNQMRLLPVSCRTGEGLDKLGRALFETLDIMRVYTKEAGEKKPSPNPFILKRGATVQDLARLIHSDFLTRFASARVWSERLAFSPQKVGLLFILGDKDVVEIHAK